ncbi:MAG: hypothetical protein ACOYL2_12860, partial [Burkholderiaceae bacterium]
SCVVLPLMRDHPQQVQSVKILRGYPQYRFVIRLRIIKFALLVQGEACTQVLLNRGNAVLRLLECRELFLALGDSGSRRHAAMGF